MRGGIYFYGYLETDILLKKQLYLHIKFIYITKLFSITFSIKIFSTLWADNTRCTDRKRFTRKIFTASNIYEMGSRELSFLL